MRKESQGGFVNECIDWLKIMFFFPLCWVIGGVVVMTLLFLIGVTSPWPYIAYFAVGIAGTAWFAKSQY